MHSKSINLSISMETMLRQERVLSSPSIERATCVGGRLAAGKTEPRKNHTIVFKFSPHVLCPVAGLGKGSGEDTAPAQSARSRRGQEYDGFLLLS